MSPAVGQLLTLQHLCTVASCLPAPQACGLMDPVCVNDEAGISGLLRGTAATAGGLYGDMRGLSWGQASTGDHCHSQQHTGGNEEHWLVRMHYDQ